MEINSELYKRKGGGFETTLEITYLLCTCFFFRERAVVDFRGTLICQTIEIAGQYKTMSNHEYCHFQVQHDIDEKNYFFQGQSFQDMLVQAVVSRD